MYIIFQNEIFKKINKFVYDVIIISYSIYKSRMRFLKILFVVHSFVCTGVEKVTGNFFFF